jgi:hypothetical protein
MHTIYHMHRIEGLESEFQKSFAVAHLLRETVAWALNVRGIRANMNSVYCVRIRMSNATIRYLVTPGRQPELTYVEKNQENCTKLNT